MKRLLLLLLSLGILSFGALLPSDTWAGEAVLSWTAPTENTDGSPLTNLAGFKIYLGRTRGGPYSRTIDVPNPAVTSFTVTNLTDGATYYFVTTAYNSADPVQESDFSNEANKTIPFPVSIPMPPTMLTVMETVYSVSKTNDAFLLAAVGRATLGSPCDPDQYIRGINETDRRHVVPVDGVYLWFGSVRSEVVVGHCAVQ